MVRWAVQDATAVAYVTPADSEPSQERVKRYMQRVERALASPHRPTVVNAPAAARFITAALGHVPQG